MLVNQLCPNGFSYIDKTRKNDGGGGVGIVYNKKLKMVEISITSNPKSFEWMAICCNDSIAILTVYRPPNKQSLPDFISEHDVVLAGISINYSSIIIAGDINIHMERSNDQFTQGFIDILVDNGLKYHIDGSIT